METAVCATQGSPLGATHALSSPSASFRCHCRHVRQSQFQLINGTMSHKDAPTLSWGRTPVCDQPSWGCRTRCEWSCHDAHSRLLLGIFCSRQIFKFVFESRAGMNGQKAVLERHLWAWTPTSNQKRLSRVMPIHVCGLVRFSGCRWPMCRSSYSTTCG